MSSGIIFEDFDAKSLDALAEISGRSFASLMDSFKGDSHIGICRHFVLNYLEESNYSECAYKDGILVGFIIGRLHGSSTDGKPYLSGLKSQIESDLSGDPVGRGYLDMQNMVNSMQADLMGGLCTNDCAEILLYAVDPDIQGSGTGRRLLSRFRSHAYAEGCRTMSLLTSDYCNVGYYQHIGFELYREGRLDVSGTHTPIYIFTSGLIDALHQVGTRY